MALSNSQYEAIRKEYQRTRDENRILAEARLREVCEAVPEYLPLSESVSTLSVARARRMLEGDEDALSGLHQELAELARRRKCLLAEHGFPEDYLEPIYRCPDCQDTGYVTSDQGLKTKCHCFRQQEISLLYAQSHIQELIERENFSVLSYEYYQGEDLRRFEAAVGISRKFIQEFGESFRNLFFYGTD